MSSMVKVTAPFDGAPIGEVSASGEEDGGVRAGDRYRHLDGTAVMVNENTLFRVDWMPFAGARASGHGVGGIPYTMHEMQTEKMMVWRSDALS